jgi:hypothetical protein
MRQPSFLKGASCGERCNLQRAGAGTDLLHVQVQAQVERLAGLITAARAPTHGAAARKQPPAKQAADSQAAAASDEQAGSAGKKRGTTDGHQRQPGKQQKQKRTKQSAVAA